MVKRNWFKISIISAAVLLVSLIIGYRQSNVLGESKSDQDIKYTTKIEEKIFGYSALGRPINGYEIGSGDDAILLLGAMHGDEMGTTELLNSLIAEIKSSPEIVSFTKKLIIIPITNPDGYYDRSDKLNANGVNLNLNFPTLDWQDHGPEGTFAGEAPFSEPSSQIIKQVVEKYNPNLMISYHSQGALVTPELSPASDIWAHWYADKTGYKYFNDWDFPGTSTKWFLEATGKPAITVEITWNLQSDWEINRPALLELISSDKSTLQI